VSEETEARPPMTEDETFIRAIVDHRGDETSRLVYADWLDDRSDPRGAFLRAEVEWARTGKKEKALRALAAKLDPVWVARVSRPPVGICADKIVMRAKYPPAATADLDAVEQQLKVTLPAEYRALLMNWNGASPSINAPRPPPEFRYHLHEINSFSEITAAKKRRGRDEWDFVVTVQSFHEDASRGGERLRLNRRTGRIEPTPRTAQNFIPIAYGRELGIYLIGVRGKVAGKVAYLDEYGHEGREPDDLEVCFPSLGALLASITEAVPEWYRLFKNGDTKGMLAWIDAGGDVNARYVDDWNGAECPLTLAIGAVNLALVGELRARGAKVTRESRKQAEYLQGWDKRKMLVALAAKPAPKKRKNR
jgi:uncharacterized protein (TIGR02996 family)